MVRKGTTQTEVTPTRETEEETINPRTMDPLHTAEGTHRDKRTNIIPDREATLFHDKTVDTPLDRIQVTPLHEANHAFSEKTEESRGEIQ